MTYGIRKKVGVVTMEVKNFVIVCVAVKTQSLYQVYKEVSKLLTVRDSGKVKVLLAGLVLVWAWMVLNILPL